MRGAVRHGLSLLLLLALCSTRCVTGFVAWRLRPTSSGRRVSSRATSGSRVRLNAPHKHASPSLTGPCARATQSTARRARFAVACSDAEPPDADLASAWLDDERASVLSEEGVEEVSPAEMAAILRAGEGTAGTAVTLLDLRTHSQHCAGRPDGAVSLPAGEPGNLGLLFRFKEVRHRLGSSARAR